MKAGFRGTKHRLAFLGADMALGGCRATAAPGMAAATGPRDRQAWIKGRALARLADGDFSRVPTAGALWYHADHRRPDRRRELTPGRKIGGRVFYGLTVEWRPKPVPGGTAASYSPD